ncbi:MAG: preprotein translocase subunit SecE [Micromonosporaceae bacterium]|nr:preprotein translocase subunit SecE [Micromonosporaceae bacterium]
MANRNRGRSVEDDGSTDEPIEDAYDDADLEDDDRAEADTEDEGAAPAGRARAGAATRERTVSRDRTKRDAGARQGIFGRLARRFRETVAEMQKVIWPTRKELLTYTSVVIIFVALVMAFVAGLDLGFARLMFLIFGTSE